METLIKLKDKYLQLSKGILDYEKFNQYAITHHSTAIEGSSLSLPETFLLLDEGLTPKNKPLEHTFMAIDHKEALSFIIELAESKRPLTVRIIQQLSSIILKNTGSKISTMAGDFDSSKGDFRKATVRAGNRTFMDYSKVPQKVQELLEFINSSINTEKTFETNSLLAFDAHFQMVSIHPFADGNGRLSRLMMNYVQHYHNQPMTIVFPTDRLEYIEALEQTRKNEDIKIFRKFMFSQTLKFFKQEINMIEKQQKQSKSKRKGLSYIF